MSSKKKYPAKTKTPQCHGLIEQLARGRFTDAIEHVLKVDSNVLAPNDEELAQLDKLNSEALMLKERYLSCIASLGTMYQSRAVLKMLERNKLIYLNPALSVEYKQRLRHSILNVLDVALATAYKKGVLDERQKKI